MQSSAPVEERPSPGSRIAKTEDEIAALKRHLAEIIEGSAFRGSHRSAQFLTYIVEQAIAGHIESLKERVIGVELFGRSPSYDTSDDAIVRVTASDVRKRLLQHYGKCGFSGCRIQLPPGSYVPVATFDPQLPAAPLDPAPRTDSDTGLPGTVAQGAFSNEETQKKQARTTLWRSLALFCAALNLVMAAGLSWRHFRPSPDIRPAMLPWTAIFRPPHLTQIITSDPAIAEVQALTGNAISVSDYANHTYLPNPQQLSPESYRTSEMVLGGGNIAAVDPMIAVEIAVTAQSSAKFIRVHSARNLRMADLKTDDNFVFLGSPRSDPWSALFSDQLDFRFVYSKSYGQEIIRNFRPQPHELPQYLPTALGGGTGQSFAIVALVQNLDQNGQVLLLAGADAEGTEAAGRFVTDLPRLSATLQQCGIPDAGPIRHFEVLLRINTMAGSPNGTDVVACHLLSPTAGS